MCKTLSGLLFLIVCLSAAAQQGLPSYDYKPQSPVTAAFTKYGDIPVDLSTGVPGISVPIYKLSSHGINVPISLSYHASGIKVQDVASPEGLGWVLNAGGVITRSVMGLKDEYLEKGPNGYSNSQRPPWKNSSEFVASWSQAQASGNPELWSYELHSWYLPATSENYDFYSDRFYYSLPNGESGIFRKDFNDETFKLIPYRPINVRWYAPGGDYTYMMIEMTTADGIMYSFKKNEHDLWHLTKIVNSTKTDSVVFYSHYENVITYVFNDRAEFGVYRNWNIPSTRTVENVSPLDNCYSSMTIGTDNSYGITDINTANQVDEIVLMDSIVSTDAVVKFFYAKDRQDYQVGLSRLTNIQVVNRPKGTLIKNVNFLHSYTNMSPIAGPLETRLLLDSIKIGANGEENYAFKYNPTALPLYPDPYVGWGHRGFQQDLWGYENTTGSNNLLLIDFAPNGAVNLFPDETRAQAAILQEVKYPTGGKTVFEYESNRVPASFYNANEFTSPPADGKVGGLRVKKISSYAYDGATPQVKSYEYVCNLLPDYGDLRYEKFVYTQQTFNLYLIPGCGFLANPYTGFTSQNVSMSQPMGRYIGGPQAPVIYDQVTEYIGDGNKNTGKIVYHYELPNAHRDYHQDDPRFAGPWRIDIGNYTPLLGQKDEYKNDNGQYKLLRKTVISYASGGGTPFSTGFNLASDLQFNYMQGNADVAVQWYIFTLHSDYWSTLHYSECIAYPELALPGQTDVYDYVDDNHYLKTTTKLSYNDKGLQTSMQVTSSKGDNITTNYTYPTNYSGQLPYDSMISRHIYSPVIEQSVYKNSTTFLQSTKNNYNFWNYPTNSWGGANSNLIVPQTIDTKKGSNDSESRIRYCSYDEKGNPVSVSKEGDTRQSYIWGYDKTYPIAQVVNASEDQVAYTSFEDETMGNWDYAGSKRFVTDNTAPTGGRCFLLVNNGISHSSLYKSGLNSSISYVVSYRYKVGNNLTVSPTLSEVYTAPAKNGWILVRGKVTGVTSIIIEGSGYIDEVRLYPAIAQMTTYTYEPLVGMTAQCDANDRITHYEYDASNRLSIVRDDDRNVLKKICYNYQGQPDACGDNTLPLWQATSQTRCKPCPYNANYTINVLQRQEIDNNVNSDSYGKIRWTDLPYASNCTISPDWQNTTNTRCVTVDGQVTGEQERQQTDVNPCTNAGTRWVSIGTNTSVCIPPAIFKSQDVSGTYYSQNCGATQTPLPYPVSMPTGSYTSSVSVTDATNLAKQAAQQQANTNGGCTTIYVRLVKYSEVVDASTSPVPPYFETATAEYHFDFYANAAGTIPLTLPTGVGFTINYQVRYYETQDGGPPSNENIYPTFIGASSGSQRAIVINFMTRDCTDGYCHYWVPTLLPGRYVIIP